MISKQTKSELYVFLLALLCVGFSLWVLSVMPDAEKMTAIAHDAKVTDVSWEIDDGDRYYTPTFTFEDSDHRTFKAKSVVEYRDGFRVGETYEVRYDPYRPKAGCLIVGDEGRLRGRAFSAYLFIFIGVAVAASVIWQRVRVRRASGSPDEAS